MSRHKEVRSQIRQHELIRLVAAVNSDDPTFFKHKAKLERNMDQLTHDCCCCHRGDPGIADPMCAVS
jgi:hypothetical protein